jgi:hypothetical protein
MEELYKLVATRTGLPHDTAKLAVDTVLDFIKKKLPAPLAAQLDSVLDGKTDLDAAAGLLGGLFGGK